MINVVLVKLHISEKMAVVWNIMEEVRHKREGNYIQVLLVPKVIVKYAWLEEPEW